MCSTCANPIDSAINVFVPQRVRNSSPCMCLLCRFHIRTITLYTRQTLSASCSSNVLLIIMDRSVIVRSVIVYVKCIEKSLFDN